MAVSLITLFSIASALALAAPTPNGCSDDGRQITVAGMTSNCSQGMTCVMVAEQNPVCVPPELVSVYAMQISSTTAKTTAATASTLVNMNLVATPTAPPASTYAGIPSGSMRPQPASVSARGMTRVCLGSSPALCTFSAEAGKALYVVSDPFGPEVRSNDEPSASPASVWLPTISPMATMESFLGDLPVGAVVDTGMTKEQGGTGCRVRAPAADGIYSSCQGKMASGFQFMEGGASQCDKMVDKFQKEMGGIPYDEMPIVGWYRDPADGVTNDWDMCGKHVNISAKGTSMWYVLPILDKCPTCSGVTPWRTGFFANLNGATIDLSYAAFSLLFNGRDAVTDGGVFDVDYELID